MGIGQNGLIGVSVADHVLLVESDNGLVRVRNHFHVVVAKYVKENQLNSKNAIKMEHAVCINLGQVGQRAAKPVMQVFKVEDGKNTRYLHVPTHNYP